MVPRNHAENRSRCHQIVTNVEKWSKEVAMMTRRRFLAMSCIMPLITVLTPAPDDGYFAPVMVPGGLRPGEGPLASGQPPVCLL